MPDTNLKKSTFWNLVFVYVFKHNYEKKYPEFRVSEFHFRELTVYFFIECNPEEVTFQISIAQNILNHIQKCKETVFSNEMWKTGSWIYSNVVSDFQTWYVYTISKTRSNKLIRCLLIFNVQRQQVVNEINFYITRIIHCFSHLRWCIKQKMSRLKKLVYQCMRSV